MKRYTGGLEGSSTGASVPVESGVHPLSTKMCHQPKSSPSPAWQDFYGGFITDMTIINSEGGGGAERSKLLIVALVFLVNGLLLKLSSNPATAASLDQKTLLSPRKFQGI